MMIHSLLVAATLMASIALGGCARDGQADEPNTASVSTPAPSAVSQELASGLRVVEDPSQVCMVNDRYMGTAQIPVEVGDKTYFGCCPMCKDRLTNDATTRTALDPVSGEPVDKATAVLAQDAEGVMYYFANEGNLRSYRGPR
jgi:YHS domain-containing protein